MRSQRQHGKCARTQSSIAKPEVMPDEARVVRLVFAWIALDRLSMREACRRLQQAGIPNRHGHGAWYASTLRGMLINTAYVGRAVYGHSRYLPAPPRLWPSRDRAIAYGFSSHRFSLALAEFRRLWSNLAWIERAFAIQIRSHDFICDSPAIRDHPHPATRPTSRVAVPREEWIEVPVPALVDEAMFEAAQSQLAENRQRKRDGLRGPRWLSQVLRYAAAAATPSTGRQCRNRVRTAQRASIANIAASALTGIALGVLRCAATGPCGLTI